MSRIGKLPVPVPKGVTAAWESPLLTVKGPGGELKVEIKDPTRVEVKDGTILVLRPDDSRTSRRDQGLYRSLVNNAVIGVARGYERKLEIVGVGYKAEVSGKNLKLSLGFAFPKEVLIPEGIKITVEKEIITVAGNDKQKVGNLAAVIRSYRSPEPYKGKGIRYQKEQVRRKAGKAAVGGKG